jgi:DHA3 family macrolide efflux protein-like MFS transporter
MNKNRPTGMFGFTIVCIGQIISLLASNMTGFGVTLWMYKQTESATAMGGMQVAFTLPLLLITPVAGAMVDRYNRKMMMMVSNLATVLSTVMIFLLYVTGHLQFWHLYVSNAISGLGNAFHWPAFSAAITTMIPKKQYGRANGMMSLLDAGPNVLAPMLAAILLVLSITKPFDGLAIIMLIDIAAFFIAVGTLLIVHVPQPEKTLEGQKQRGNILKEAVYGFAYIFRRPSLLGLQLIFFTGNLFAGMFFTLLAPMILARSDQNSIIFGSVQMAGAIGGVIGGIIMSAWGGFKRRVYGVLLGWVISGLSFAMLGVGQGLPVWITAMVIGMLMMPLLNTSNQAIWQSKVTPDVQGRVFSARRLIAMLTNPISPIIAGTLADFVLEPAMRTASPLASTFGWLVGTGPGAGMGLLMLICGILCTLVGLAGYFFPSIRNVERILPDHDQLKTMEAAA